jgi:uncharacterized protein (TIGR02145 family)
LQVSHILGFFTLRYLQFFIITVGTGLCFVGSHSCNENSENPARDSLAVVFEVTHVRIYGVSSGEIVAHVSGGNPPYSFFWSNGQTDSILTGLAAGTYYLEVGDAAGSQCYDSARIEQPDELKISLYPEDASGMNTSDGSIGLEISGGVPPYGITWSTGDTGRVLESLNPGMYAVEVTDRMGAARKDSAFIGAGRIMVTDIDGNQYTAVRIGEQVWMKENLSVTRAPDGTLIDSYCYNDDTANVARYGRLYTWDMAMNGSTLECSQGICPEGWHLPSDREWIELEICLGMSAAEAEKPNTWRGTDEGARLREGGSSGYDALYSGRRSSHGYYSLIGSYEYIWTSSEDGEFAWRRCLRSDDDRVGRYNTFPKTYAFSVRCIKNKQP